LDTNEKIRHNWTRQEVFDLMNLDLETLLAKARAIHQEFGAKDVQQCVLLSVKTGACPEDCKYCSQSAHYKTELSPEPLMDVEKVKSAAWQAKENGATRFCMGAAWRSIPRGPRFNAVLEMVREVSKTGMEVCCTLGMAEEDQLTALKEAGLTAYNHNLDTSREHYSTVITSRTYDDRLRTLAAARKAGVQVCCGGILGMGETLWDRAGLLTELSTMNPHPESVPINLLVPIEGTPMESAKSVPFDEFLRTVATARIVMPKSRVRLSAGRNELTDEQQLQCFSVGANSIFVGEKLLTTPNVDWERDRAMMTSM
jgi:biotin synthase